MTSCSGVGYYLYNAGGDPKVAQKNAAGKPVVDTVTLSLTYTADAHKLEAKVKSELPNTNQLGAREKQAEAKGESLVRQAGNEIDRAVSTPGGVNAARANTAQTAEGQKKYQDIKADAQSQLKKAGTEVNAAIDKFDAKVTQEASKAKSGISSWFGGK